MNSSKLIIADDFGFNHTNDIAMLDLCSAEKIDGLLPLNPADKILGILREIYASEDLEPTLIMCHPGMQEKEIADNFFYSQDRGIETKFLMNR